jgi:hypothetical protein
MRMPGEADQVFVAERTFKARAQDRKSRLDPLAATDSGSSFVGGFSCWNLLEYP